MGSVHVFKAACGGRDHEMDPRDQYLALAQATHQRLGGASPARVLGPDLLSLIAREHETRPEDAYSELLSLFQSDGRVGVMVAPPERATNRRIKHEFGVSCGPCLVRIWLLQQRVPDVPATLGHGLLSCLHVSVGGLKPLQYADDGYARVYTPPEQRLRGLNAVHALYRRVVDFLLHPVPAGAIFEELRGLVLSRTAGRPEWTTYSGPASDGFVPASDDLEPASDGLEPGIQKLFVRGADGRSLLLEVRNGGLQLDLYGASVLLSTRFLHASAVGELKAKIDFFFACPDYSAILEDLVAWARVRFGRWRIMGVGGVYTIMDERYTPGSSAHISSARLDATGLKAIHLTIWGAGGCYYFQASTPSEFETNIKEPLVAMYRRSALD